LNIAQPKPPLYVPSGRTYTFVLNVSNSGAYASPAVIKEYLPAGTTFNAAASSPGWQYDAVGGYYTLNLGVLAARASKTVHFAVTLPTVTGNSKLVISNKCSITFDLLSGYDLQTSSVTTTVSNPSRRGF
jgi:hypothetical protein